MFTAGLCDARGLLGHLLVGCGEDPLPIDCACPPGSPGEGMALVAGGAGSEA